MDRTTIATALVVAVLIAGAVWHYVALRSDLSAAVASNASLTAANQSNLAAIDALVADKARTEAALAVEAIARKATADSLNKIRKDIQNAQTDPACLAADDRDRALAYGLRNLLASPPD